MLRACEIMRAHGFPRQAWGERIWSNQHSDSMRKGSSRSRIKWFNTDWCHALLESFFWILFVFFGTCEFHPVHPAHQLSIARSTCMAFGVGKLAWQSLGEAVGMKRLQVQPAYYLGLLIEGLDSRLFSSSCMLKLAFFSCIYSECATWWPKLFCNQTAFI